MDGYEKFNFISFFVSYALILTNLILSVINYKSNATKETKTGLVNNYNHYRLNYNFHFYVKETLS
jgi:hypothetical protein